MAEDTERTGSLWFALLLTITNGFLDSYTYIARRSFRQLGAIDTSKREWPLLAIIAGVALASYIKSGRLERAVSHPLRWTMVVQALALAIIGFIPLSVPHSYVTVPISLLRNVGELVYLPVATTGNLLRMVEGGYAGLVEKSALSRRAFGVYGALTVAFPAH
jgi:uncharacterized membrane protein YoaK (UPF0700 family)